MRFESERVNTSLIYSAFSFSSSSSSSSLWLIRIVGRRRHHQVETSLFHIIPSSQKFLIDSSRTMHQKTQLESGNLLGFATSIRPILRCHSKTYAHAGFLNKELSPATMKCNVISISLPLSLVVSRLIRVPPKLDLESIPCAPKVLGLVRGPIK